MKYNPSERATRLREILNIKFFNMISDSDEELIKQNLILAYEKGKLDGIKEYRDIVTIDK